MLQASFAQSVLSIKRRAGAQDPLTDDYGGAHLDVVEESLDLGVRHGDTALRPIKASVDFGIRFSDAVQTDVSTENRVLGQMAHHPAALQELAMALVIDQPGPAGPVQMVRGGVVKANEDVVIAAGVDSGDAELAERRGLIPLLVQRGRPSPSKRQVFDARVDSVDGVDLGDGAVGVDEDPALRCLNGARGKYQRQDDSLNGANPLLAACSGTGGMMPQRSDVGSLAVSRPAHNPSLSA